jgi:putative spermidine/putrescine transport system ATP-binding protein
MISPGAAGWHADCEWCCWLAYEATMAQRNRVELRGVAHAFGGAQALTDVSLAIEPGELIALLGPSGCGKTTLLRVVAGFIRPTQGVVSIGDRIVNDIPAGRRKVGLVFQNYALFPHLTVVENVAYGLKARGATRERVAARVAEMLDLVKMATFAKRLPAQLSGGQQQRVALARALAIEPDIVLLDEPFSALDKNLRIDMQIEIKALLKDYGLTSIIVTHDQEEALSMADRIVVLNHGRIEQIDTPEALYDRPGNTFVNRFVGQTNFVRGTLLGKLTGRLRIALEGDASIETLAPNRFLVAGGSVLVSIRPENLQVTVPPLPGTIPAVVRITLPLGPIELIEAITAAGEVLKVSRRRSPSIGRLAPGTEVGLAIIDPSGVSVFAPTDSSESFTTTPHTHHLN